MERTASDGTLNIYGQAAWHDAVHIVGDEPGLKRLRDAIDAALTRGKAVGESVCNDGEGYSLCVAQLDRKALDGLSTPYTDPLARDPNGTSPWRLFASAEVIRAFDTRVAQGKAQLPQAGEPWTLPLLAEDGYPGSALLARIRAWPMEAGWQALLEALSERFESHGRAWRLDEKRYGLATGGWSGNEDMIDALKENFLFWGMCWEESRCGGRHVFTVARHQPDA